MAPARGNAALQHQITLLEQQVVHAQELTTAKHGELVGQYAVIAAKDGELTALRVALGQAQQQLAVRAAAQGEAEGGAGEHAKKRARLADDSCLPLNNDEVLDTVFSYVGIGDYITLVL
jgi:hypothetical protein